MKALTEDNFVLYAAANYTNLQCYNTEEFLEDLNTFTYIKRLLSRYTERGELRERLILNHLIKLYNVFNAEALTRMLFFRVEDSHWPQLKSFLMFLSYMPEHVYQIGENAQTVVSHTIPPDDKVLQALKQL